MVTAAKRTDAVWYPVSDDTGTPMLQVYVAEVLRPLVERWLEAQRRVAHAGANQFFYWVKGDPTRRLAPDVYVVDGVPQRRVRWQVFRRAPGRGMVRVLTESGDRVWSQYLGCYLRVVDESSPPRVRLGTGLKGDLLFTEYADVRCETEAALAQVARLERMLDDLRSNRG